MNNAKNKSIILMSGGLDSLAVLGLCKDSYNIDLALTFDYGQKSALKEIESSKKICEYYNIKHKIIQLNWLKDITQTSLVSDNEIPSDNFGTDTSAQKVWVPNRNSLFLNIAAAFADSYNYTYILFGANKDEGETFPDNTEAFRTEISKLFEYSTMVKPRVIAPLINHTKDDIVKDAIEHNIPLEYVRSCYRDGVKHCGKCESCNNLKQALIHNNAHKYIELLFGEM